MVIYIWDTTYKLKTIDNFYVWNRCMFWLFLPAITHNTSYIWDEYSISSNITGIQSTSMWPWSSLAYQFLMFKISTMTIMFSLKESTCHPFIEFIRSYTCKFIQYTIIISGSNQYYVYHNHKQHNIAIARKRVTEPIEVHIGIVYWFFIT